MACEKQVTKRGHTVKYFKKTHTHTCAHTYLFLLYIPFCPSKFFLTIYPKKLMKAEIVMYVKVCAYIKLHKCTQNSLEGYILRYYGCLLWKGLWGTTLFSLIFAFCRFSGLSKRSLSHIYNVNFLHVKIIKGNKAHPQQLQPKQNFIEFLIILQFLNHYRDPG